MAICKMKKLSLLALRKDKTNIINFLQEKGNVEIIDLHEEEKKDFMLELMNEQEDHDFDVALSKIGFALDYLKPYYVEKKDIRDALQGSFIHLSEESFKNVINGFYAEDVVLKCQNLNEEQNEIMNHLKSIDDERALFNNWKNLDINLNEDRETNKTKMILGAVGLAQFEDLKRALSVNEGIALLEVNRDTKMVYVAITFLVAEEKELQPALQNFKFNLMDLPKRRGTPLEEIARMDRAEVKMKEDLLRIKEESKKLTKYVSKLRIMFDHLTWEKEQKEMRERILNTDRSFILKGWVKGADSDSLVDELVSLVDNKVFIDLKDPKKDDKPPVIIENKGLMKPFEAVTGIYGLPLSSELDPTPFLAVFFIVYFGLCLTDAAYGVLMFVLMFVMLKFFRIPKESQSLIKLLMYAGLVTFVIGAVFGGWFGMDAAVVEKYASYLVYTNEAGEKMFILQKINALTSPLTVLILALILGYLQILVGILLKATTDYKNGFKKEAFMDSMTWFGLLVCIGGFITGMYLQNNLILNIGKYGSFGLMLILVLTQGRNSKSIIGKLFSGILSLYNLVGYMSDILSYSRILALGLATAIIAMAVNVIVGLIIEMVPYAGWILAAIVFIGGHMANLVLSALGSFIHSGRLQFVEFFTKFIEGGGKAFKPFKKESKYVHIKNEN